MPVIQRELGFHTDFQRIAMLSTLDIVFREMERATILVKYDGYKVSRGFIALHNYKYISEYFPSKGIKPKYCSAHNLALA